MTKIGPIAKCIANYRMFTCISQGCHDPGDAHFQSNDAIWLWPDPPAGYQHQQPVHPRGPAETAAAATSPAGQRR